MSSPWRVHIGVLLYVCVETKTSSIHRQTLGQIGVEVLYVSVGAAENTVCIIAVEGAY